MKQFFLTYGESTTDEEIGNYIQKYHLKLPLEYKKFLKEVNGGITKDKAFELGNFDYEKKNINYYVDIDEFFSLKALHDVWIYTKEDLNEYNLFPVAEVRGGMLICCKQEESVNAEMFFYDNNFGVIALTKSLSEFLNLLIPESEVDFKKYGIDY